VIATPEIVTSAASLADPNEASRSEQFDVIGSPKAVALYDGYHLK
jgi:hypothetical protein